jgi:hypothetical protein
LHDSSKFQAIVFDQIPLAIGKPKDFISRRGLFHRRFGVRPPRLSLPSTLFQPPTLSHRSEAQLEAERSAGRMTNTHQALHLLGGQDLPQYLRLVFCAIAL